MSRLVDDVVSLGRSYDNVPYPSHAFRQTHPDRLACIAKLFGMTPRSVERCRVLELGCASGGNLLPMATLLPESEFVGIDLSQVHIDEANATLTRVGTKNIEFRCLDLSCIDSSLGEFDYIICHGVYSWVPPEVQDRILEICRHHLTPHGVAYVSYNTFPGWHMRGMIRDMMRFHSRRFDQPADRIREARGLLKFLSKTVDAERDAYGMLLNDSLEMLGRKSDAYLFHDHLEAFNEPLYFHEFIERAGEKKLQYLGEADLESMYSGNLPDEVSKVLRGIAPDAMHLEQYMDFVKNRSFRQTLLCHADVAVDRSLASERLSGMYVASSLRLSREDASGDLNGWATFKHPSRALSITPRDALTENALKILAEVCPSNMALDELISRSWEVMPPAERTTGSVQQGNAGLAVRLLKAHLGGLIDVSTRPSDCVTTISEFPRASSVALDQARRGLSPTSCRQENVRVNDLQRFVLSRLDGSQTRDMLTGSLEQFVRANGLKIQKNVTKPDAPPEYQEDMEEVLDQCLAYLAASSLLLS